MGYAISSTDWMSKHKKDEDPQGRQGLTHVRAFQDGVNRQQNVL